MTAKSRRKKNIHKAKISEGSFKLVVMTVLVFVFSVISLGKILTSAQVLPTIKFATFTPPPTKKTVKKPSVTAAKKNTDPTESQPTESPSKKYLHFAQKDPLWRNYTSPTKFSNIGDCGCGDTCVAMILASNFDKTKNPKNGKYAPPEMWDEFARFGRVLGTNQCGTNLEWHVQILQKYGMKASVKSFDEKNREGSINVLKKYLNSDWQIILLIPGHYVLLDQIKGDSLLANDPLQPPESTVPKTLDPSTPIYGYVITKV